jgi:hypothetical protein
MPIDDVVGHPPILAQTASASRWQASAGKALLSEPDDLGGEPLATGGRWDLAPVELGRSLIGRRSGPGGPRRSALAAGRLYVPGHVGPAKSAK